MMYPSQSTAVDVSNAEKCSATAACYAFGIAFAGVTWAILLIGTAIL